MQIFFIFWPSKIRVNPTGVVCSLSPPRCRRFFDRRRYTITPCHASFSLSQDKLTASASSSDNASSHRLPSRVKTEVLNPHHCCRLPTPGRPTLTLYCYKKIISTLVTLPTTQLCLHFVPSLARVPRHQSSTSHRRSLSPMYHIHCPSAQ
jgi:hypothetical protein